MTDLRATTAAAIAADDGTSDSTMAAVAAGFFAGASEELDLQCDKVMYSR